MFTELSLREPIKSARGNPYIVVAELALLKEVCHYTKERLLRFTRNDFVKKFRLQDTRIDKQLCSVAYLQGKPVNTVQ